MAENTLSVLKIAPGQHPQQVEIDNDLKALQQAVGGSIDAVYPAANLYFRYCFTAKWSGSRSSKSANSKSTGL